MKGASFGTLQTILSPIKPDDFGVLLSTASKVAVRQNVLMNLHIKLVISRIGVYNYFAFRSWWKSFFL